jgi:hypothetical protein
MLIIDYVYKKLRTVEQLPRRGRRIPISQESEYLGTFISRFSGGYEIYRARYGLTTVYNVFDPDSRRVELAVSGTRFVSNPKSFKIYGVYARPNNRVRAIQVYEFLIKKLGLTLISDQYQSPGGYSIWKRLNRKKSITVYGYDFRQQKIVDISGPGLKSVYVTQQQIDSAEPGKIKTLKGIARNVRLVACLA